MNHFPTIALKHDMCIRMPIELFYWVREQAQKEGVHTSRYVRDRLQELAKHDLRRQQKRDLAGASDEAMARYQEISV